MIDLIGKKQKPGSLWSQIHVIVLLIKSMPFFPEKVTSETVNKNHFVFVFLIGDFPSLFGHQSLSQY